MQQVGAMRLVERTSVCVSELKLFVSELELSVDEELFDDEYD